jgi:hypothetical protein
MSTNAPIESQAGPHDLSVEERVGRALRYLAIGVAAFLAGLVVDLFGVPALIVESVMLVVAIAVRSRTLALVIPSDRPSCSSWPCGP